MFFFQVPKTQRRFASLSQEDISVINKASDISEKVDVLTKILEIPSEECITRRNMVDEVKDILKKYYPDCSLIMYGSSVNGFGTKCSDVDLFFLPFPGYKSKEPGVPNEKQLLEPSKVLSGEVDRDVLLKLDDASHIKFVQDIFYNQKDKIKKALFVRSFLPFLRIHLRNNKIACGIRISNQLHIYSTEIFEFFGKIDKRVKPLVMTLLYWAKNLYFIRASLFSSYSFTLLVIFFLQNTNPPILPSIQNLIKMSGSSRMIDGWQTAFVTDTKAIPPSENKESIGNLLQQFFEFYWNFNFVENIISVHTGSVLPIKDLKEFKDERIASFEMKNFNIQDPFVLSKNVFQNEGNLTLFKLGLYLARQVLRDNENFCMLLSGNAYQSIFNIQYENVLSGFHYPFKSKLFSIRLDRDLISKLNISKNDLNRWYDLVSQTIFDVLQYGLLMESEILDKIALKNEKNSDDQKTYAQINGKYSATKSYSFPDLELLISIQCLIYLRTWIGRKNVTEKLLESSSNEFPSSVLNYEHSVSKNLIEEKPLPNKPLPLLGFRCDCYKYSCSEREIPDVVININPFTSSKEISQVSAFLASYLPKTVKKILLSKD